MITTDRVRLVYHGGVMLIIALLCGLPSVVEVSSGSGRMWQGAHAALLTLGVWLIATASVLPLLVLPKREATALVWSLLLGAYSFMVAVILQATTGVRVFSPDGSLLGVVIFLANVLAVLGSFTAASLTVMGAHAALRAARVKESDPRTGSSPQLSV